MRTTLLQLTYVALISGCTLLGSGETTLLRAKSYDVSAPKAWRAMDSKETDSAYRLLSDSIVTLTSSCDRNPDAPLDALTRHLLMGMRNVVFEDRASYSAAGTQGQYSRVRATLEGKAIHLHLFVLSKNACIFDFVMMNKKPFTSSDEGEFRQFIESFRFEKRQ